MLTTFRPVFASASREDRVRMRRAAEKKRLEQLKSIRTNLQSIVHSERAFIADLRKKYEPNITFVDDSSDDDDETAVDSNRVPIGSDEE